MVALRGVAVDGLGISGLFADDGGVISSGYFGFMVAEDAAPAGVCDPMEGILPGMDEASGILSRAPDPKDGTRKGRAMACTVSCNGSSLPPLSSTRSKVNLISEPGELLLWALDSVTWPMIFVLRGTTICP